MPSVPASPLDDEVPVARTKRRLERQLADSGMSYVSLRLAPFTELWLAMVGSSLAVRGEQRSTLDRPYGFLRGFRRLTGRTVERFGVMLVPGPTSARHTFISIHDVARLMTAAVDEDAVSGCVDVGGPEILSWDDVAALLREALGRPVRVIGTPAAAFGLPQRLLAPFAPSVSDIMGLERAVGMMETAWDTRDVTDRLGVTELRTVREVLQDKAALRTPVGSGR
jgi:uncharacterized protein YbjT (DUF2867 family)